MPRGSSSDREQLATMQRGPLLRPVDHRNTDLRVSTGDPRLGAFKRVRFGEAELYFVLRLDREASSALFSIADWDVPSLS